MNAATIPTQQQTQPFAMSRAVAVMGAVVAVALAAVVFALEQFGATAQKSYAIYAALICGGTAVAAFVPVWWLSRRSVQGAAMGFMAGIGIRLAVCGLAVIIGGQMDGVERGPWSMWIAGWYMLVLMVEVAIVGRYVAQAKGPMIEPGMNATTQDPNVEYRATQ
jgi:hypothetical protein